MASEKCAGKFCRGVCRGVRVRRGGGYDESTQCEHAYKNSDIYYYSVLDRSL